MFLYARSNPICCGKLNAVQLVIAVMTLLMMVSLATPAHANKITVMFPGSIGSAMEHEIKQFTSQTGIEVELVIFGTWFDLMEKLPTMVAGGIAPDVVYHDTNSQGDLYYKNVLRPIEEFVVRDHFDLSMWPQPLIEGLQFHGELYSLPTGVSNWVTFYNVNKMYAAGLSDLPIDWDGNEFTFDDMVDHARKLTMDLDGDGIPEQYGTSSFLSTGSMQAIHLWDLDWINDEQTEFIGTSSEHIDAILDMNRLRQFNVIGGNWMNGTAVMMPMQPYYLNTIKTAMDEGGFFDWDIGVLPKAECRCVATSFHSLGMVRNGSNPDGAWEFIKHVITSPSAALTFSQAENRVPVSQISIDDFHNRWEMLNPGMNAMVLTTSLNHIVKGNWNGLPRQIYDRIANTLHRVLLGQEDPRNALEMLKPTIDGMLKELHGAL